MSLFRVHFYPPGRLRRVSVEIEAATPDAAAGLAAAVYDLRSADIVKVKAIAPARPRRGRPARRLFYSPVLAARRRDWS